MNNIIEVSRLFFFLFFKDKLNLFFGFFFNAFLMIMLGLFVNNRFDSTGTIGVNDQLNSVFSRQFISVLEKDPALKVKMYHDSSALVKSLKDGNLVAGLRINKSFEALKNTSAVSGNNNQIDLIGNSSKDVWLKFLSPGIKMAVLSSNSGPQSLINKISIGTQIVQARNVDYFKFIFPGVLVFSIMGLSFNGSSALLFFRKSDVLKRLKITPLTKLEFLTGFILSYFVLLILQAILYIMTAWLVFQYSFTGDMIQIVTLIGGCGLLFIVLGVLIANLVPSVDFGSNIIRFLSFPASFLCGVFIPIDTLPKVLQSFSVVHPLTYFTKALRNAVNNGASWHDNAGNYWILAIIFVLLSVTSILTFEWDEQT